MYLSSGSEDLPLPAWIPFTSSQSAALSEKKRAARQRKKGKHPRDFSPVVSLGSGVKGQQLRRDGMETHTAELVSISALEARGRDPLFLKTQA
ncbi:hypothetical protein D4764_09G0003410, partial [Takifugu flavidus]